MIQANELRIGNWVKYKNKYYQIYDGIRSLSIDDLDSEKLDSHLKNIKLSDLEPIELTEEILLKCGFLKHKDIGYRCLFKDFKFDLDDFTICFIDSWLDIEIKHLHQLQNIYYALCNEELNVQL